MATAWSVSTAERHDTLPVTGTAAITSDKALEIRADLDFFGSQAAFHAALDRLVAHIKTGRLPLNYG